MNYEICSCSKYSDRVIYHRHDSLFIAHFEIIPRVKGNHGEWTTCNQCMDQREGVKHGSNAEFDGKEIDTSFPSLSAVCCPDYNAMVIFDGILAVGLSRHSVMFVLKCNQ